MKLHSKAELVGRDAAGAMSGGRGMPDDGDIVFQNVTKKFSELVAVDDISFAIESGSFTSILGPSGCGKTTTLRMIAGFDFPTAGNILIGGKAVGRVEAFDRPINMVFQNYALFPHLNVFGNIAYGLRSRRNRRPNAEIAERVGAIIEKMQLDGKERNRIWELSGGQQQRVALARAIVNNPKILILDEPMAALDKKLRRDVQFELQTLQRELGITFIMVTHDQHEALSLSDRIIVMNKGRIEQIGSPDDLYFRPATRFVASFIGDFNQHQVAAGAGGDSVDLGGRIIAVPSQLRSQGPDYFLGYRPDALRVRPAVDQERNDAWSGRISNIIHLDDRVEIKITTDDLGTVIARASAKDAQKHGFDVGMPVALAVEKEDFHFFTR